VPRSFERAEAALTPGGTGRVMGAAAAGALLALALVGATPARAGVLAPALVVQGYASGETFQSPRGIAFDPRDGAIYVANTGAHRIEIFSRTGRPLGRFVHRVVLPGGGAGDGEPCALAFDRSGRLLVADQAVGYVDVLDRRGRPLARLDVPAGHPTALAVGADGTIFVGTAAETSQVHRFRPDGRWLDSWGKTGGAPGHLEAVTALAVLPGGEVAVACARTELVIQIFTAAGNYLRGFAAHEMMRGDLALPSGIVATPDGRIWVSDEIRQDIQIFDRDGGFIAVAGDHGVAPGQFGRPGALAFDGADRIAVAELDPGRFQVLVVRPGPTRAPASER
jgi:sugar lactone lactonase YvrE